MLATHTLTRVDSNQLFRRAQLLNQSMGFVSTGAVSPAWDTSVDTWSKYYRNLGHLVSHEKTCTPWTRALASWTHLVLFWVFIALDLPLL